MSSEEQQYVISDKSKLSIGDVQAAAKTAWVDLHTQGSAARARAEANGIDVDALPESLDEVIRIRSAGAGFGSLDLVLGALAPIGWDLWKHVLLPHIRERWGDNAIKAKNAAAKKAATAAKKTPPAAK